jgi:hypothetical protein
VGRRHGAPRQEARRAALRQLGADHAPALRVWGSSWYSTSGDALLRGMILALRVWAPLGG